jgi:hypothetical protein
VCTLLRLYSVGGHHHRGRVVAVVRDRHVQCGRRWDVHRLQPRGHRAAAPTSHVNARVPIQDHLLPCHGAVRCRKRLERRLLDRPPGIDTHTHTHTHTWGCVLSERACTPHLFPTQGAHRVANQLAWARTRASASVAVSDASSRCSSRRQMRAARRPAPRRRHRACTRPRWTRSNPIPTTCPAIRAPVHSDTRVLLLSDLVGGVATKREQIGERVRETERQTQRRAAKVHKHVTPCAHAWHGRPPPSTPSSPALRPAAAVPRTPAFTFARARCRACTTQSCSSPACCG